MLQPFAYWQLKSFSFKGFRPRFLTASETLDSSTFPDASPSDGLPVPHLNPVSPRLLSLPSNQKWISLWNKKIYIQPHISSSFQRLLYLFLNTVWHTLDLPTLPTFSMNILSERNSSQPRYSSQEKCTLAWLQPHRQVHENDPNPPSAHRHSA